MDGGVVAVKTSVLAVLNLRHTLATQMQVICGQLDKWVWNSGETSADAYRHIWSRVSKIAWRGVVESGGWTDWDLRPAGWNKQLSIQEFQSKLRRDKRLCETSCREEVGTLDMLWHQQKRTFTGGRVGVRCFECVEEQKGGPGGGETTGDLTCRQSDFRVQRMQKVESH